MLVASVRDDGAAATPLHPKMTDGLTLEPWRNVCVPEGSTLNAAAGLRSVGGSQC